MSKAIKLCETAIRTITVVKFYENYMMKSGRLSWDTYKEKLEQVPDHKMTNSPDQMTNSPDQK